MVIANDLPTSDKNDIDHHRNLHVTAKTNFVSNIHNLTILLIYVQEAQCLQQNTPYSFYQ